MKQYMNIIKILLCCFLFCSCTDVNSSENLLKETGFSSISITGWKPNEKGLYSTGFDAIAPDGKHVKGQVTIHHENIYNIEFDKRSN